MLNKYMGIVLLVIGCIGYFMYSQTKIEVLTRTNSKLTAVVTTNEETIDKLRVNLEEVGRANIELGGKLIEAEKNVDKLVQTLSKHNLSVLAKEKPGMVEKRINNATKKVFSDISSTTDF